MAIWGEEDLVPAITGASGITTEQAKTCFYYAIATYLTDRLYKMPILAIIGPHGTGKSSLLNQLRGMVNQPKIVSGESAPTLRDELGDAITALIDEGDHIREKFLIRRYERATSSVNYKMTDGGRGWGTTSSFIFGATIIVRREPFKDQATRSRSIVIKTRFNGGNYKTKRFSNIKESMINVTKNIEMEKTNSDRAHDNWAPLQKIASSLGDKKWLKYSNSEIENDIKALRIGQDYEPGEALLMVLNEKMNVSKTKKASLPPDNILLSAIRDDLQTEFDIHLKNSQIMTLCSDFGFNVVSHAGYPKIKTDIKLLNKLLKQT